MMWARLIHWLDGIPTYTYYSTCVQLIWYADSSTINIVPFGDCWLSLDDGLLSLGLLFFAGWSGCSRNITTFIGIPTYNSDTRGAVHNVRDIYYYVTNMSVLRHCIAVLGVHMYIRIYIQHVCVPQMSDLHDGWLLLSVAPNCLLTFSILCGTWKNRIKI
jgi:hypothetical protein